MPFDTIRKALEAHSGSFRCVRLDDESVTRTVAFRHEWEPPAENSVDVPPQLAPFYRVFGSLRLYSEPVSGESAFYIGAPSQWQFLDEDLRCWFEGLSEQEEEELLPGWIDDCVVFGEIPGSGNYLMMPLSGEKQGRVFEFEHDGFEFIELAPDHEQLLYLWLHPCPKTLTDMASHMRFIEDADPQCQWWMVEMQDNRGNRVRTRSAGR
jgi:hypothetical protein